MKPKALIKELSLLALLFASATFVLWVTISINFGNSSFDINLHDLYFTFAWKELILPAFLFLIVVVYLIKEAFYKYQRRIQNIILLVSAFVVNIYFLSFIKLFAVLFSINCGGTVYPPLSAMHDTQPPMSPSSFDGSLTRLYYTQIIFLVILVIVSILTGKSLNNTKNEHKVS